MRQEWGESSCTRSDLVLALTPHGGSDQRTHRMRRYRIENNRFNGGRSVSSFGRWVSERASVEDLGEFRDCVFHQVGVVRRAGYEPSVKCGRLNTHGTETSITGFARPSCCSRSMTCQTPLIVPYSSDTSEGTSSSQLTVTPKTLLELMMAAAA